MEPTFEKQDDNTLKVTMPAEVIEHTYDYDFLVSQKAQLETELQKVNDLLGEADKAGVVSAVNEIAVVTISEVPSPQI